MAKLGRLAPPPLSVETPEFEPKGDELSISEVYRSILSKIDSDLKRSQEEDARRNARQRASKPPVPLPIFMYVPPQFFPDVSAAKKLTHMYKLDSKGLTSAESIDTLKNNSPEVARMMEKGAFTEVEKVRLQSLADTDKHVPNMVEEKCGRIWSRLEAAMKPDEKDNSTDKNNADSTTIEPQKVMEQPGALLRAYDDCVAHAICKGRMLKLGSCWQHCMKFVSENASKLEEDPQAVLHYCFELKCRDVKADVERCQGNAVMKFMSEASKKAHL